LLLAMPGAVGAAEPVELTYDDAVKCAALDTALAIVLTSDEANASDEDRRAADYYSKMADTWLGQAGKSNPGGEEATLKDIIDSSTTMLTSLADEKDSAAQARFTADIETCTALEEAAYGGPNGMVD